MTTQTRRIMLVASARDIPVQELAGELRSAGPELIQVPDPGAARHEMESSGLPHLIVVDLGLPGDGGFRLCEELFDVAGMPIITLAPKGKTDALDLALRALECSDDYLRRPFAAQELALRIRRVLSRIGNFGYARGPQIRIGDDLSLDQLTRMALVAGEARKLTPTENALLEALLAQRGEVVHADTLIERVWRLDPTVKDRNALRVHIHRLRHKIEVDPDHPKYIMTGRGMGYSFAGED